jgi:Fe-S oxidoreductase
MTTATRLDTAMMQGLRDLGVLDSRLCFNCGSCAGICPLSQIHSGFPRKVLRQGQLGTIDFESEDLWACATCRACVQQCPRGVEIIDYLKSLRNTVIESGFGYVPKSLHRTMLNLIGVGNPFGEPPEKRAEWATEMGVKSFTADMEYLLFMGCYAGYDPLVRKSAVALVNILNQAETSYGILGARESCCGESANKAGNEKIFQQLASKNIEAFQSNGVRRIVTISPHCYQTFKNEYAKLGANLEVIHYTQLLAQLIREGKLKPGKALDKKVTYHDPCYLGRHNGVYDEPREVLRSIPGLDLLEMTLCRENSFCCGGGGGKIWQEARKENRISDIRLQQAIETGSEILVTACPYCKVNLEDSKLVDNERITVTDVSQLVWETLQ